MSILSKRVEELSSDDLDTLKKPLGIKGRPYPMRTGVTMQHGNGDESFAFRLGVIEDDKDPLLIYSDHDYSFVTGVAMRDMPTPSMLPLFFDALSRRAPGNKRTIQFLKGAAGAGKTYMSEFIGKMRDPRGPLKIDCGQKNLAELLFETVLDFNQDRKFYDELDKKLKNNQVNPLTVKLLKNNLGDAVIEENGRTRVLWDKIGHDNLKDENGETVPSEKATKTAMAALREISQLEGLDGDGGNALGMATQEGPLIRAWKEGREIILDEFNRGKPGSTGALHGVLQFLAGELDEITVENTLKEKGETNEAQIFVFKRSEQRAGFFVTLTGNAEEDGEDVDELPQSVNSRIMPQTVPVATIEDWQHRICQILTGIPLSTIYYSSEQQWSKNPEAFRNKLLEWRTMGMTEEQISNISPLQLKLLDRWEDTLEATEKLANFYYSWSMLTNPDSKTYQRGDLSHILLELDENYHKETTIDFRKITAHINEALEARPSVVTPEESEGYDMEPWSEPPQTDVGTMENDPSRNFGTRLRTVLLKYVNETTQALGKTALFRQLDQLARDCGLKEAKLKEGKASSRATIEALLNEDPYQSRNPRIQARIVRDMLCTYWKEKSGKGGVPVIKVDNEELLSSTVVQRILQELEMSEAANDNSLLPPSPEELEATDRTMYVITDNFDQLSLRPFTEAANVDSADLLRAGGVDMDAPATETLVARDDFLMSLAIPKVRDISLSAMWSDALSQSGMATHGFEGIKDESLAMAEGCSETGLGVTTLVTRLGEGENARKSTLHVVHNQATGKTLIVGDKVKSSLKDVFNACGVHYVERGNDLAEQQIAKGLRKLLPDTDPKKNEGLLKNAFLMRNSAPSCEDNPSTTLASLLVAKDMQNLLPQYIVRKDNPSVPFLTPGQ